MGKRDDRKQSDLSGDHNRCKALNNSNWETVINQSHNAIIFIDEETKVITKPEFAAAVKASDNYYVIITRENLPNLPYSVEEVYGMVECLLIFGI